MSSTAVRLFHYVILAASAALLFLTSWILIPAPSGLFLPLAVGAPELSPILLAAGIVLTITAARFAKRNEIARLSLILAATASAIACVPVVQLPIALRRFERAIAYTTAIPRAPIDGTVRVTRGVHFSRADGVPLALDVYRPPAAGKYPVIMQIYGGSWQNGAPTSREEFSRYFAQRGYVVVAIDYRHAPEWIWPEQIVDVRTAFYWISEKSDEYDGDPSRVVVVGWSAGAQLAMRLAYQEGPSTIRGVVNYYGPVDLADGWRRPPSPDPLRVRTILEAFLGGTPAQKPEHYKHASPITWVSKASAPTLSIYGTRDHIVEARYGRMLHAALQKAGASSVLLELPWAEHSFDAVPNGMGVQVALRYVERFIAWAVAR